jgi:hypothetical protein
MDLVIQTKLRGSNAGDGSKKMVLVLKGAMEELSSSLDHAQLQRSKIEVSRAMQWLNSVVISDLAARLREKKLLCRSLAETDEELQRTLTLVTTSSEKAIATYT